MTERHTSLATLLQGRDGLRVVADIHGQIDLLAPVLAGAMAKNYAVLSMGDLIDRGPNSPAVVQRMLDHLMVPGNHDDKLRRHLQGRPVKVGQELQKTLDQFAAAEGGPALMAEYAAWVARLPLWIQAGRWFFVHGGFHPHMLGTPAPTGENRGHGALVSRALYGESDGSTNEEGYPNRTYNWLDEIPAGLTVVVGHDVQSVDAPLVRTGASGGTLVNLDTGADRGGPLSFLDIPKDDLGEPERFAPAQRLEAMPVPTDVRLTLLIGPSGAGKSTWVAQNVPDPASVFSTDALRQEMFGDFKRQIGGDRVFFTIHDRVKARLARGLPAVIDATHCRRADRLGAAKLVPPTWKVRYVVLNRPMADKIRDRGWRSEELLERHEQIFRSNLSDILKGDGLPNVEVVDQRQR